MNNYYVYIFLDPRKPGDYNYGDFHFDYEPFYVGKGKGNRYNDHIKQAMKIKTRDNNYFKIAKIRNILNESQTPIILFVKQNLTDDEACKIEIKYISTIGRFNLNKGPLTNMTNGGDTQVGFNHSEKTKIEMSKNRKGEKNGMYNKHHTKYSNESNRQKHIEFFSIPANRINLSNIRKKYFEDSKNKEKMSLRRKNCLWVHNETEERYIHPNELESYFSKGYVKGRFKSYKSGNYKKINNDLEKEIIRLYVKENKTVQYIVKLIGVKKVKAILKENNIKLRSRSESTKLSWTKRKNCI